MRDVGAVQEDLAVGDLVEAHQAAPEGGFAAAGFADQAQGLAGPDLERDAVHGIDGLLLPRDDAAADPEMLLHVDRLQQRARRQLGGRIIGGAVGS